MIFQQSKHCHLLEILHGESKAFYIHMYCKKESALIFISTNTLFKPALHRLSYNITFQMFVTKEFEAKSYGATSCRHCTNYDNLGIEITLLEHLTRL